MTMKRRDFLGVAACGVAAALAPPALARPPSAAAVVERNRATLGRLLDLEPQRLRWDWIVLHHTATKAASLAGLDRYHRKRFDDPLGCQYHFVIQNGKRGPRGQIEVARWRHQDRGVHLFHPARAPRGIAVSLVGNFEEQRLPGDMFDATVALCRGLMEGCGIPVGRVTTHRRVDGRLTQCPGKRFPTDEVLARLV